ncbi:MAG: hypothetical protein AB1540_09270, partial [Bdellovibrionota bacterium]
ALNVEDLKKWRQAFPKIRISIGFEEDELQDGYTPEMTSEQLGNAIKLGGYIDFNLRAPRVNNSTPFVQEMIALAIEHPSIKSVSISPWNWPDKGDPEITQADLELLQRKVMPVAAKRKGKEAKVLLDLRLPYKK